MSSSMQSTPSPVSVFQAQFGIPPGTQDPRAECAHWERLCAELLAEQQRLRAELDRARLEKIIAEETPVASMKEIYAQVDRSTSIQEIIAEMERELEPEK
ncbi:MAG: hypothetical protein HYX68_22220 [Planctomycetes bacterium]|nr:hypothetical protein [Planctomycetota bacterium]